jgi:hypothetical protein
MGKSLLHVPSFESGIILAGSADAQATTELKVCDNLDIGPRGQLQSVASAVDFQVCNDQQGVPQPFARAFGIGGVRFGSAAAKAVVVGLGRNAVPADRWFFGQINVEDAKGYDGAFLVNDVAGAPLVPLVRIYKGLPYTQDPQVTFAPFSFVTSGTGTPANTQVRLFFINLGARYPDAAPREMPGLYVMIWTGAAYAYDPIGRYDALGTGIIGEFAGGNQAKQLYFRGIEAYNNHLFGFGFDQSEAAAGEGPSRLMFSNVGNPLKWGNDDKAAAGVNRAFSDTDAITVGGAGEVITALKASKGRLWIGTNRGLHYLSGYGRDSFKTDGTTGIANSLDVVGPNALCEGPDGMLYGVSSKGLWCYANGEVNLVFNKLRAFDGSSPGYMDLVKNIGAFPGPGDPVLDRIWLRSEPKLQQVWMVIPAVNASTGIGHGFDTVIIKYHVWSGGFTRQIISGINWMGGCDLPQGVTNVEHTIVAQYGSAQTTADYGTGAPPVGQKVSFGEYSPFGPDAEGVCRAFFLTLSWPDAGALPIVMTFRPIQDGIPGAVNTITIGNAVPAGPVDGDTWLDTSGTDTNIGNATAGAIIPATHSFVQKTWIAAWNKWILAAGGGGQLGTRATIRVPFTGFAATRIRFDLTVSSSERIQIEGIAMDKGATE